ncbi:MAG: GIY-YIG nuclease family protein [Pacificimonas sp.]|jgi:putative endonuclease|nr:GIY-YIG nuclease family protein [Pacificimonas sp.]
MMASHKRGTLYIGVTTDIARRAWEHKEGVGSSFCKDNRINRLVWLEEYFDVTDAIAAEKRMKAWQRAWKIRLIEEANPDWDDLALTLL